MTSAEAPASAKSGPVGRISSAAPGCRSQASPSLSPSALSWSAFEASVTSFGEVEDAVRVGVVAGVAHAVAVRRVDLIGVRGRGAVVGAVPHAIDVGVRDPGIGARRELVAVAQPIGVEVEEGSRKTMPAPTPRREKSSMNHPSEGS